MAANKKKRCASQWCEAPQEEPHNASPRPTSCMLLEKESHKAWEKDSIHMTMRAKMQCCFRWYSLVGKLYPGHDRGFLLLRWMRILLLTCPRCLCFRLLGVRFSHSLTTAVCDSVLWLPRSLRKCWCFLHGFPLPKSCQFVAAKISNVRSSCWQRRIR